MTRVLAATAAFLMLAGAAHGFGLGMGTRFGRLGAANGPANVTPPPPCSPGANTGDLDFSVCSNIIYVPALIH